MGINSGPFFEAFSSITDPRSEVNKKHLLIDILFITLCGLLSGCRSWDQVADFAKDREEWLRKYLKLPFGIPSHDAIRYLFLFLNPKTFNASFVKWVKSIAPVLEEQHIAFDGKTNRRSGSKSKGVKALHVVSAWSTSANLVLGQIHVNEKSNEITAIPELIDLLDIKGCFITIDAMGCQKKIAEKIISNGGHYGIAVKKNQKHLYEEVKDFFDDAINTKFKDMQFEKSQDIEKDHGRIEKRFYYMSNDIGDLIEVKKWCGLKSLVMVVSKRIVDGIESIEKRYYICSYNDNIEVVKKGLRNHWGIENSLHWVLDVSLREDECRKRSKNSAKNISILRKISLNLLKSNITYKGSIESKMLKAARNTQYVEKLLGL